MSTITAVVHTKNSAKTLDTCLRSLAWCDAIFVVDMQSTDKTVDIAMKYGAKVYAVKESFSFADPVRNEYLQKVKTDWTLIVDSDEEVPHTLSIKLKELMLGAGIDGYSLPRKNIIFGKWMVHTGYWPDYIIRFFRTGKATYPQEVHGQPVVQGRSEPIEAKEEFALIHHHYTSIFEFLNRLNVYTTLEVPKLLEIKKDYSPLDAFKEFFAEFHRRFFQMQGYKDGSHGFTLSLLSSAYQMVSYLKAWEVKKNEIPFTLDDVESLVERGCDATSYWVANEELKQKTGPLKRIGLKISRKLHS